MRSSVSGSAAGGSRARAGSASDARRPMVAYPSYTPSDRRPAELQPPSRRMPSHDYMMRYFRGGSARAGEDDGSEDEDGDDDDDDYDSGEEGGEESDPSSDDAPPAGTPRRVRSPPFGTRAGTRAGTRRASRKEEDAAEEEERHRLRANHREPEPRGRVASGAGSARTASTRTSGGSGGAGASPPLADRRVSPQINVSAPTPELTSRLGRQRATAAGAAPPPGALGARRGSPLWPGAPGPSSAPTQPGRTQPNQTGGGGGGGGGARLNGAPPRMCMPALTVSTEDQLSPLPTPPRAGSGHSAGSSGGAGSGRASPACGPSSGRGSPPQALMGVPMPTGSRNRAHSVVAPLASPLPPPGCSRSPAAGSSGAGGSSSANSSRRGSVLPGAVARAVSPGGGSFKGGAPHAERARPAAGHPSSGEVDVGAMYRRSLLSHEESCAARRAQSARLALPREYERSANVNAIALSADGSRLVAGGADRCCAVYDALSGKLLLELARDEAVDAVDLAADASLLVLGGRDRRAAVYALADGGARGSSLLCEVEREGLVWAVALAPDTSTFAVGGRDHAAAVYDARSGALLFEARRGNMVTSVAYSPDGARLAVGGYDKCVCVVDALSGNHVFTIARAETVMNVAFHPDGLTLAAVGRDHKVAIMDAITGAHLFQMERKGTVYGLAYSADGTSLAVGGRAAIAAVFDAQTGELLGEMARPSVIASMAFSADGSRLAVAGHGRKFAVLDTTTTGRLSEVDQAGRTWSVAATADVSRLAVGGVDRKAEVYDVASGEVLFELRRADVVTAIAFSDDASQLAVAGHDNCVAVYSARTGLLEFEAVRGGHVWAVAFARDGGRLAAGGVDNRAAVLDASSGELLLEIERPDAVRALAWSADGAHLALGGFDKTASVYDAASGLPLFEVRRGDVVLSVCFAAHGGALAIGGDDHSAAVLAMPTGRVLYEVRRAEALRSVAFSHDGAKLAIGGEDKTCAVVDARTGAPRYAVTRAETVIAVVFSADDTRLVLGLREKEIQAAVLNAATGELLFEVSRLPWVVDLAFATPGAPRPLARRREQMGPVFDAASGGLLLEAVRRTDDEVLMAAFSADGACLAVHETHTKARKPGSGAALLARSVGPAGSRRLDLTRQASRQDLWRHVSRMMLGPQPGGAAAASALAADTNPRNVHAVSFHLARMAGTVDAASMHTLAESLVVRGWHALLERIVGHDPQSSWLAVDEGAFELALRLFDTRALALLFDAALHPNAPRRVQTRLAASRALLALLRTGGHGSLAGRVIACCGWQRVGETLRANGQTSDVLRRPLGRMSNSASPFVVWRPNVASLPDGAPAVAQLIPLPCLGCAPMLRALLLHGAGEDGLWGCEALGSVLDALWSQHFMKFHWLTCALLCVEVGCFCGLCLAYAHAAQMASEEDAHTIAPAAALAAAAHGGLEAWLFGLALFFSAIEVRQLTRSRRWGRAPRNADLAAASEFAPALAAIGARHSRALAGAARLGSRLVSWDVLDWLAQLSVLFSLGCARALPADSAVIVHAMTATALCLLGKTVNAARGFRVLAHPVEILLQSTVDMLPLLFICLALVFFFALGMLLQFSPARRSGEPMAETAAQLSDPHWFLLGAFDVSMLGEWGPDELSAFGQAASAPVTALLFVLLVVIVTIIALNTLIALLADTFERVQDRSRATRTRQLSGMIVEWNDILPAAMVAAIEEASVWTHRLMPESMLAEDGLGASAEGWQGRTARLVGALRTSLEHELQHMRAGLEASHEQTLKAELERSRKAMAAELERALDKHAARREKGGGGGGSPTAGARDPERSAAPTPHAAHARSRASASPRAGRSRKASRAGSRAPSGRGSPNRAGSPPHTPRRASVHAVSTAAALPPPVLGAAGAAPPGGAAAGAPPRRATLEMPVVDSKGRVLPSGAAAAGAGAAAAAAPPPPPAPVGGLMLTSQQHGPAQPQQPRLPHSQRESAGA